MEKEQLERIRQLARKQKAEGLTSEEAEEQQRLHIKYLDFVRIRVKKQLEEAGHCHKQK
ncbi:MAG TPA: DUF896 domain-containing protein [Syntrophomonadaceae bacterium]|jgi:uncharacterized protein YnzC (UPF0291/DUF896 family)|nr:DUF896 domain-containing protein [Syntrophomonadaceae bacterium]HRX20771.1 DUF896 domain-containing protein [Syntrophomonadaceae bacterium]